jgi:hypothetical protein
MTERSVEVERLLEDVWNYVQHYKPSGCTFIVGKGYDCKCGLYEAMDNVRAALLREKARADGSEPYIARLEHEAKQTKQALAQTAARLERIDLIGGQMANVMYNWRQDDKRFTERERKMMDDLQAAWDAALQEPTHG